MVTCYLIGRCGNQCFEIATTIATALRNNDTYFIPRTTFAPHLWDVYFTHLPEYKNEPIEFEYDEPCFEHKEIHYKYNMRLHGFFASFKYFEDYRKEILRAFRFKWVYREGLISIHVRRGDYLERSKEFVNLDNDYYKRAIDYFYTRGYNQFVVLSDDIEWCKTNFTKETFGDVDFYFSAGTPLEDMGLLSECENNICSNSTFAMWGAWLNRNPNKIVLRPERMFTPEMNKNEKDLFPESWIVI